MTKNNPLWQKTDIDKVPGIGQTHDTCWWDSWLIPRYYNLSGVCLVIPPKTSKVSNKILVHRFFIKLHLRNVFSPNWWSMSWKILENIDKLAKCNWCKILFDIIYFKPTCIILDNWISNRSHSTTCSMISH